MVQIAMQLVEKPVLEIVVQHVQQDVKTHVKMVVKLIVMLLVVLAAQMTVVRHVPLLVGTVVLMTVPQHAPQLVKIIVQLAVRNHARVVAMIHAVDSAHLAQVIVLLVVLEHVRVALEIVPDLIQQILPHSLKTSYETVRQLRIIKIENKLKGSVLSEPLFFCLDKKYFICYNIIVNKERDIKSQNKKIILTK